MEKLELFRNLPEGFRKVEDDIDRKLAALTLTQAFADSRYPIPSNSISYSEYMRLYYELAGILISNAEKVGLVLANEDFLQ